MGSNPRDAYTHWVQTLEYLRDPKERAKERTQSERKMSDEKPICDAVCVICKNGEGPDKGISGTASGHHAGAQRLSRSGPAGP